MKGAALDCSQHVLKTKFSLLFLENGSYKKVYSNGSIMAGETRYHCEVKILVLILYLHDLTLTPHICIFVTATSVFSKECVCFGCVSPDMFSVTCVYRCVLPALTFSSSRNIYCQKQYTYHKNFNLKLIKHLIQLCLSQ